MKTDTSRQLSTFALVLPVLVLPAIAYAVSQGVDLDHIGEAPVPVQLALYGQAFAPAIAAAVAFRGRGFPWGFVRVPPRTLLTAWAIPVIGIGLAYGTGWLTGLASFGTHGLPLPPLLTVVVGLVPGLVPYLVLALGEQLGWSSFLVTRLGERHSADVVAVVVGVAWALFHVPLMVFVPGAVDPGVPMAYALLWFTVQTIVLAFPLVWLRLTTRSIWPVLVVHATFNAATYFVGQAMTQPQSPWLLGEGGVLTTAGLAVAVAVTTRWWRQSRVSPAAA
ncbi:CPBP family intramembrane metalloprotease [Herbidospora sp. NEAU-GS84]|uniref:CPBP family intramembrane metalloprotease n=1 Tax=Herbidospora solisilvae TaxID=2696284 RepID=A0A7C9NF10_9ACTN|nr:CPBP family glutamic-type intramembrane protease [Herbidospora solisilvae]NAS21298.1 CPBP family intramembrane metalloprotease [Herbidospora solisilvae]